MKRRLFLASVSMFLADKLLAESFSLNDINGIKYGGRLGMLDAESYEKRAADFFWNNVFKKGSFRNNPIVRSNVIQRIVQQMAMPLYETSTRKDLDWRIVLVDSPGVIACTCGGGVIVVDTELVRFCENEEEFAGVIAHEIGHNEYRHAQKSFLAQGLYNELSSLREIRDRAVSREMEAFLNDLGFLAYKGFERLDENEADAYIVNSFFKSGYDVKKSSAASEMLLRLTGSRKYSNIKNCLYSTHPESKERLERVRGIESTYSNKVTLGNKGLFVELQERVRRYKA